MHLTDYISAGDIIADFKAEDKARALKSLCDLAAQRHGLDPDGLLEIIMKRENLGSTGLGGGVALPHGQSREAERPLLLMAVSPQGVEFNSLDGLPVHIFVLIITPVGGDGREHLQILARLGSLFTAKSAVEEVLAAAGPEEIYAVLAKRD